MFKLGTFPHVARDFLIYDKLGNFAQGIFHLWQAYDMSSLPNNEDSLLSLAFTWSFLNVYELIYVWGVFLHVSRMRITWYSPHNSLLPHKFEFILLHCHFHSSSNLRAQPSYYYSKRKTNTKPFLTIARSFLYGFPCFKSQNFGFCARIVKAYLFLQVELISEN